MQGTRVSGGSKTRPVEHDVLGEALHRAGREPALLPSAVLELGRLLVEDVEPGEALHRVCDLAEDLLTACHGASITYVLSGGRVTTRATSREDVRRVDQAQYDADAGPCLDTARDGGVRRIDLERLDTDEAAAWAGFAEAARGAGYRHALAAPLRSADETLGALNLFGRGPEAFDALDETVATLFAQLAAVVLRGRDERYAAQRRADQLEEAMRSRAVIEQAKGALAALDGGDPEEAYRRLHTVSTRTNTKLRVVAAEVVERVGRGLDPWDGLDDGVRP